MLWVLGALLMTTAAGLSTGIGGLAVLLCRRPTEKMLAFSLGFAGGVMITVSLSDMLPHAVEGYLAVMDRPRAAAAALSLFLLGMLIAALLRRCLPEPRPERLARPQGERDAKRLMQAAKSAAVTTAVMLLHNLPEGILTLFTGYASPAFGLGISLAVALHNIPEGVAVSVPIYYATGSRLRGAATALLSGLAEPAGALAAFFFLRRWISPLFLNGLVATIAGIMSCVAACELLPGSFSYDADRAAGLGFAAGLLLMSLGVCLL